MPYNRNADADVADVLSHDIVSDESPPLEIQTEQELSGYTYESRDVPSSAKVLGVADADGDNVVDVCVLGPADATVIWVLCDRANMVDASGHVCVNVDGPNAETSDWPFKYVASSPVVRHVPLTDDRCTCS